MANINWLTVGLLVISNLIMLYAWYGHLQSMAKAPLWLVILISWGIALVEYCFAVPANRIGKASGMSVAELKIIQEAVALLAFVPFSIVIMKEQLTWNYAAASICIFAAVFFIFWK